MTRAWAAIFFFLAILALASPASAQPAPPASDPQGDAHSQLEKVLNDPLFSRWRLRQMGEDAPEQEKEKEPPALVQWMLRQIETWRDWIGDKIRDFFRRQSPGAGNWSLGDPSAWLKAFKVAGWVVLALAVMTLAILTYYALRGRRINWMSARVLSREQVLRAMDQGQALALEAPQWLGEAQRLAQERDPRAVYRALYLALLSGLHAAGKIDFRRNRTNWVYVNRFKGPGEQRGTFAQLTEMFDEVWYGERPAEADRIEQVRRDVSAMIGTGGPGA